ncbi:hypothetical protein STEG23_034225, partial [Scotinomys teguina]
NNEPKPPVPHFYQLDSILASVIDLDVHMYMLVNVSMCLDKCGTSVVCRVWDFDFYFFLVINQEDGVFEAKSEYKYCSFKCASTPFRGINQGCLTSGIDTNVSDTHFTSFARGASL